MRGFRFRSVLYSERCAHICLALSQNSNVWRPTRLCLNPLWTYFLVTCPRLNLNDGITARGCAWMSPEEAVVVFVQCFYTDVAKTSISNFQRVGTALLRRTSTSQNRPEPARFFHVGIFWVVDKSNTKFERHIACRAWSAVKWITRQV